MNYPLKVLENELNDLIFTREYIINNVKPFPHDEIMVVQCHIDQVTDEIEVLKNKKSEILQPYQYKNIFRRFEKGFSDKEISKQFDLSLQKVQRIIKTQNQNKIKHIENTK